MNYVLIEGYEFPILTLAARTTGPHSGADAARHAGGPETSGSPDRSISVGRSGP